MYYNKSDSSAKIDIIDAVQPFGHQASQDESNATKTHRQIQTGSSSIDSDVVIGLAGTSKCADW